MWNDGPADLVRYARSEAWMRGSTNVWHRRAGYAWYLGVALPLTVAVTVLLKVVRLGLSRFTITIVAAAVLAALAWTWPGGDTGPAATAPVAAVVGRGVTR